MCRGITKLGKRCGTICNADFCKRHISQSLGGAISSKKEIKELDDFEDKSRLNVIRQVSIPGIGQVDGYVPEINTVLEYHGNYFHGNPYVFNSRKSNGRKKNPQLYGDLFAKTLACDRKIVDKGYNLISLWETPLPGYMQLVYE